MPHINYCDTCAHWEQSKQLRARGCGLCTHNSLTYAAFGEHCGEDVLTCEADAFADAAPARIVTGQSFGCVHHFNMDATVVEAMLAEDEALYGEDL